MFKKDNMLTGVVCGTIAPLLGFYTFCGLKYHTLKLTWLIRFLIYYHQTSAVLSLCLIANLGIFYLFLWRNRDLNARGVLLITIVYAIIGFALKFVL